MDRYPASFVNGIEQNMVSCAAGIASERFNSFPCTITPFLNAGYERIRCWYQQVVLFWIPAGWPAVKPHSYRT